MFFQAMINICPENNPVVQTAGNYFLHSSKGEIKILKILLLETEFKILNFPAYHFNKNNMHPSRKGLTVCFPSNLPWSLLKISIIHDEDNSEKPYSKSTAKELRSLDYFLWAQFMVKHNLKASEKISFLKKTNVCRKQIYAKNSQTS